MPPIMEMPEEPGKLEIGEETLRQLNKARKWAMFLAVCGFIFLGLMIVLGLLTGTFLTAFKNGDTPDSIPDIVLITGFIAIILINFFPILFLFRFSTHASNAVTTHNPLEFQSAMRNLKRFFVNIGIILILALVSYLAGLAMAETLINVLRGL
jgi:hypothetical protein